MFVLMIARGFPTKDNPQWGCFEKDQAEALAAYGHKVISLSIDARFKKHKGSLGLHQFACNGVLYYNYVILPGKFFSIVTGAKYYRENILQYYVDCVYRKISADHGKPDIIYAHFFWNMYSSVLLKERYNVPIVGIEHLGRFNEDILPVETETIASKAFPKMDAVIAVSEKLASNISSRFKVNCHVINNMYGKEFLEVPNEVLSKKTKNKFAFVSVGRIDYKKGYDILIESFAKAGLAKDSWELNIIGWGDQKDKLEKFVNDNNLQINIHFLGKKSKEDIVSELRKSDVFILASRLETFGIVFIEAMSQGLPVVGTICGGPEEIINSSNGILVPSDDIDAMASAIKRMIETYSQYDRNQIAEDCKKRFSPEAIAGQLTDVFEKVLNKKNNGLQKD